jgi:hypothetical protein
MDASAVRRSIARAIGSHPSEPEIPVMRPIRVAVLTALLAAAVSHAETSERRRYLELVNRTHDSVTSLAFAQSGDSEFHAMLLASPLNGGGDSTTIEVAGDSCRYDFRFTFNNRGTLIYRDIDICRHRRLRIRQPRD